MTAKRTLVLVFHPNLAGSKVNAALAAQIADLEGVTLRDMYAIYPDGVVDVAAEQQALEAADRIVLQFPVYWYSTPALLKSWEDAVLTYGWAYGSEGTALHGKELLVAASTGADADKYQREGVFGYTVTELLRPLQATSNLIGTTFLKPFITSGALAIDEHSLKEAARAYAAEVNAEREVLGAYE